MKKIRNVILGLALIWGLSYLTNQLDNLKEIIPTIIVSVVFIIVIIKNRY